MIVGGVIDPKKITNKLNWKPLISLESGLEATVKWYISNEGWWNALLQNVSVPNRFG